MRGTPLLVGGAALTLAGLVLLVVESARVLGGSALGGAGPVLVWLGVGLVVVGGIALLASVAAATRLDRGEPANG
jgi:hypothetical protein